MSSTQNVGNNVGAVNDFQPFMDAPNLAGAHGKRNVAVSKRTGSITSKTKISSRSFSSKATLRSQRKVDTRTPSQLKTIVNLSESQQVFHSLIRRGTISTEAKAVYSAALVILDEVAKCKDFSATNIQKAIKIGLNHVGNTTGFKGTVGFFKESDNGSQTGQDPLANDQECINAGINLELDQLGTDKAVKNKQNTQIADINFTTKKTKDSVDTYDVKFKDSSKKLFKIHCPKDFPINEYTNQLCAEADTYSGDITIKKAKPGSVFVRVFGKGQSPLRPCWCNAGDINSAVTNAKDLYDKLGVNFKWNGDGNMAVLVVPNDIEIYFAEGTIASQIGEYKETNVENGERIIKDRFFIFQGGGTQTNILAKNVSNGYRPFANQTDLEIWEKIMFVFRNDGIIDKEKLSQPPAQNSQKSEQK